MKITKNTLCVGILLCISLSFNGCEDKQTDTTLPVEDTTEIIGAQDIDKAIKQKKPLAQTAINGKMKKAKTSTASGRLLFVNRDGTKYRLIMQNGKLLPDPKSKPIVLINLFDINDHASVAQIPYLTKLRNEYGKHLTILGIPTNQSLDEEGLSKFRARNIGIIWLKVRGLIDEEGLKTFISMHQIDYFISYESSLETIGDIFSEVLDSDNLTTPTTLIYHNGEADAIYEGAVPIEMITHDIVMINKE